MPVHLIKLSVGTESVEDLAGWQALRIAQTGAPPRHVTRMWPKREAEILGGGSIYWVIKGQIQARQRIVGLEEVDRGDGIRRCAVVLDPQLYRVAPTQKRPFQGWRYLKPEDAPRDLPAARESDDSLPPELDAALAEIGVI
ncbi:DUF1489 family protein [Oceanicola sp. S124]|uniref:DUF1489 family protein n=1 Tax=Oceanicola sp. S124 TaxID=1042378 RepID=UPI000255821D|nr:DUF1489 domain-containing protein [Oceanicola sp. S124]